METNLYNAKKRTGLRVFLWIVFIVLIGTCGGIGYWQYTLYLKKDTLVKALATAVVGKGEVRSFFDATGVVKSTSGATVTISSRVSGTIQKIAVYTGEKITAKHVILKLDSKDIALAVQEGEANLAKAKAEKQRIQNVYPLQLEDAKQAIQVAEGGYTLAKAIQNKERADNSKIPQIELDKLNQQILVSQTALQNAKSAQKRLETEYTIAIQTANASIQQAQAQVSLSKNQLSYYTIYSPMNATVSTIFVREGEQVQASSPIATIIDTTRLDMWIYVDESDIGFVKKNVPVTFTVDALPDTTFSGSVAQIYPEPEVRDGVVYYKALVPISGSDAKKLFPEMTAQVKVVTKIEKNVVRVPNTALKWINSQRVLFVKKGEQYEKVIPEMGIVGSTYTEIRSGVQEGDTIATEIQM